MQRPKDSKSPHSLNDRYTRRELLTAVTLTPLATLATLATPTLHAADQTSEVKRATDTPACARGQAPISKFAGKVAFVTGGSSGIGLGIVRAFLDVGMKVAFTYRTESHRDEAMKQLHNARNHVHAISVDVTDRAAMERAAQETVDVFGKVHILVNNAGVYKQAPIGTATREDWDWMMNVNVQGVHNGIQAFLPHIEKHGDGGHIVTTSSIFALIVNGTAGAYSVSKAAVLAMMECLRSELANTNIGVSVCCPGNVSTNIGQSERNGPMPVSKKPDSGTAKSLSDASMDPWEMGKLVLRGIQRNDLYILTHPEFEQGIRDRNEALVASIPKDLHPPPARVNQEKPILRNPIYAAEIDRQLCNRKALT